MSAEPSVDVDGLARLAVDLATGAAGLVRAAVDRRAEAGDGGAATVAVSTKSTQTDLVTEVDRASEQWLVEHILAVRPDDAVLGEEGGERPGTSGVRWILDPIDGTVNFVLGLPQYAVSVGVEVDGTVVAGAVCNPVTGELYRARLGGGAFLGEDRLSGPRSVPLDRAVVATGFGYAVGRRVAQARVAAQLLGRIADIRRMGAASLDLCALARGVLDGYYEVGLNPWDYAAGGLIAAEAGCVVTGPDGGPASPALLLAAGPELHPALAATLAELGAADV